MRRRRRDVLLGATAAAISAQTLPAPAIAQGAKEPAPVTSWTENMIPYQVSADPRIKIRRFSDEPVREFGRLSKEIVAEIAAKDPLTRKVADSSMAFLAGVMDWGELSETGYRNTRRLALA